MNESFSRTTIGRATCLVLLASIVRCCYSRTLRMAHTPGHIPKEVLVVADGSLPPMVLSDVPFHGSSTAHSHRIGAPNKEHLTLIVRKKVPRKMMAGVSQVHPPTHRTMQGDLKHRQELEELDRVFHHVEEEHLKAFEEHHRDPIRTHYSLDASGRINHVTVDEEIAYDKESLPTAPVHHDAWQGLAEHEGPTVEELEELAAVERMEHEQIMEAPPVQETPQNSKKSIDELLWEDHKPEGYAEPNAANTGKLDLEKEEWEQGKQNRRKTGLALALGILALVVLFAAVLIKILPMHEIFGRTKKRAMQLKRKASIDPQPWHPSDSRYGPPAPRSPVRRPSWLRRDRSPERGANTFTDSIL